jgi:hypothetical protein
MKRSSPAARALVAVLSLTGAGPAARAADLVLHLDAVAHTISVHRQGAASPILTQNARPDFRPYLHPIVAPDGLGIVTEFSPGHHKHQTGLYWGFTRVNGRDYFHNPSDGYWRRLSFAPVVPRGTEVTWATVYHLLDAAGQPVLAETQTWTMRDLGDRYVLDLEWKGEGLTEVTVARYDYGGLFLRMPWRKDMEGAVVNSHGQRNSQATGQRALWVDVGLKLEGRPNQVHIAMLDHPMNRGHPLPWRVDAQFGIGPCRAIAGDWQIAKGATEIVRHRLVVYTGELAAEQLDATWSALDETK